MLNWRQFRVLTFDCYGTLIDWERGILQALRPVLQRHGVVLDDAALLEQYASFESEIERGPFINYRTVLETVVRRFGEQHGFRPSDAEARSLPESLPHWQPFPDTIPALQALSTRYKLAIISNVDEELFAHSARLLQVPFLWVITADQVGSYKPAHANFHAAFARIGAPKAHILHVAQSLFHDHVPARELGLATVWVNRRSVVTGSGATPPAPAKPDVEVPTLQALAELMGLPA